MSAAVEVGFIFQCSLCGSYSVYAIDALDPHEVSRRAAGCASNQKVLQRDVHSAEQELLEVIQARLLVGGSRSVTAYAAGEEICGQSEQFVLLPCPACIEILTGKLFTEWLDDKQNLENPTPLCPHVAVTFSPGELPPAFTNKSAKWCLFQGVGPKDLEVKPPNRLPAGQFRSLLPPLEPAIRPPCWQKEGSEKSEPAEVWEERKQLVSTIVELLDTYTGEIEQPSKTQVQDPKQRKAAKAASIPVDRAPVLGLRVPWIKELCSAAEEAWAQRCEECSKAKERKTSKCTVGAKYLKVPVLSFVSEMRPLVDAHTF